MPRGGARNRSGPAADPTSGRSDARGYSLTMLPAEGYRGRTPKFPLPRRDVYHLVPAPDGGKGKVREFDDEATVLVAARELALWKWAWRTPQACAWARTSERWRWHTIAMWVRTAVICESSEATAADKNSLHRFADQIGLTTAGLAEMGWQVAPDEMLEKRAERAAEPAPAPTPPRPRRLRSAGAQ
jgi:hypothetical protein